MSYDTPEGGLYEVDLRKQRAAIAELVEALGNMIGLIDDEWLVRNTADDGKPGFAYRQLPFVKKLADAQAVLAKHRSAPRITTSEQLPGCWVATTDNYDGPGSPIGMGFSEQAAVNDLLSKLEEA